MPLKIFNGESCAEETSYSDDHYLGQFIPLHYHYHMLQDIDRTRSFRTAIEASVRPNMKVVELGGGTGILSSFAARAGARVQCVERNPALVDCARRLARLNNLEDRIEVISQDATQFIPQTPVDVVICEMLHVAMLREKQLSVIAAFKDNYLKAFGPPLPRFIPEISLLTIQLVEQCFEFEGYYAPVPMFQTPAASVEGTNELSSPIRYGEIVYDQTYPENFNWNRKIRAERTGTLNAIRLLTQNILNINDSDSTIVTWANQFLILPLVTPIHLTENEMVPVQFAYQSGDDIETFSNSLNVQEPMSRRQHRAA